MSERGKGRGANFERCNHDVEHQRMAGLASFVSFSAHWRAWQGLPLLHPSDVVYLTPGDFHGPGGRPLPPAKQRRLFREYVAAAACLELPPVRAAALASWQGRRMPMGDRRSADLAFVRLLRRGGAS
ncbi:MAG TPA: hypothetical protein VKV29_09630 [Chthonomonas sp.]|uniref:hypothetical protein n=1 Tax=Chthonomonas sp. TaxID=2282153 RepID=UPI002B4B2DC3|nr:hypothetical protein [Chthonomonas sp.]HLH80527.1 hypothetical protein [Chthonomonas sp.]